MLQGNASIADFRSTGSLSECRFKAATGHVEVTTGFGVVRIGEVMRGSIVLGTGYGQLEVGIRNGTSARLHGRSAAQHPGSLRGSRAVRRDGRGARPHRVR
ncbi:MAG: hypothetical protein ACRDTC_23055 [Pseudonocardiaceae bacterium]